MVKSQQVARMELAECGAFRDNATVSPCSATLHTGYETEFNSAIVKVVTEDSVVYLMGRVFREEGSVVINVTRLQPNVKQIITVFEYID